MPPPRAASTIHAWWQCSNFTTSCRNTCAIPAVSFQSSGALLRERFAAVTPPFFITSQDDVPSIEEMEARQAVKPKVASAGEVLKGDGCSSGIVRGRARVVLDPSDAQGLKPGDILVAPLTDPAWTPLFLPAGGVVVNVGALMSHAVIVSRELGIPCVVAVANATNRIADGSMLEVDGAAGTVTILGNA